MPRLLSLLTLFCAIASAASFMTLEAQPLTEPRNLFLNRRGIQADRWPQLGRRQNGDLFDPSSTASPASTSKSGIHTSSSTNLSSASSPSSAASSSTTSRSVTSFASSATASSASSGTLVVAPTASASSLPKPFDTSLGSNFTTPSCPSFFKTFLANATFVSCLPFSLLLQVSFVSPFDLYLHARGFSPTSVLISQNQNSNSFFQAEQSASAVTATLDATCAVVYPACATLMSSLASSIVLDQNCGSDYRSENPLVLQAYNGFLAYPSLYTAGCLRDADGNYCFANAVTNTSSPQDSYPYYLPLGIALPPGQAAPSCDECLKDTMGVFDDAAANQSLPISIHYTDAAQQINGACGANFVNATITPIKGSSPQSKTSDGVVNLEVRVMMLAGFMVSTVVTASMVLF
ncbi:hypothetical protein MMC09_001489 [Bachmanniomyces sp. S44760]|nr:hypothetical protein [Bachmanniomyces sp. S44760]